MSSVSRRDFVLGGSMAAAAGLGWAGSSFNSPRRLPGGGLEALIPKEISGWTAVEAGGVIVPDETELSKSTYDEVLTRVYVKPGAPPIMLLIAYGGNQNGNMQLHRPEACYPAAGFSLVDPKNVQVTVGGGRSVAARAMAAVSNERREQLLYWTRIGDEFPLSPSAQRWAVIRDNLRGQVPDGVLVRVSAVGGEATPLRDFVLALTSPAIPAARALLVGA